MIRNLLVKFAYWMESRRAILWLLLVFETIMAYAYATGKAPANSGIPILLMAPGLVAFMLFQNVGSPKNWWAPFFGTTVTINEMKTCKSAAEGDQLARDLAAWIKEMNIKGVYKENAFRYTFLRRKHATMFKLAWG